MKRRSEIKFDVWLVFGDLADMSACGLGQLGGCDVGIIPPPPSAPPPNSTF
jgi:hypothetical protein